MGLRRSFGTKSRACGRTAIATRLASRVRIPAAPTPCETAQAPRPAPGCSPCPRGNRREDRDPDRPADLVPGRVQTGDHSRLALARTGEDRDRDGDHGDSEPEAGDEHPGKHAAEIAAVRADVGEESHAHVGPDGSYLS